MLPHAHTQYVLCLTGMRSVNKRMALFVEGVRSQGLAVRISSLPRGHWRLDKSEHPIEPDDCHVFSIDIGNVREKQLASVMCFHWMMLPIAVFVGLIKRVPVLYDEHDHYELNTQEGSRSRLRQIISGLLVRWIHRCCLPWVSVVTCIHMNEQSLKKHLQQWQSDVIEIHNYPATVWRQSARLKFPQGKLCFVYIGGVFAEKGPGVAAEAMSLLTELEREQTELHIFGDGDRQLMQQLRQSDSVVVHDSVTPAEFRRFASEHRCCGLSLLASTRRYQQVGTNCTKLYEYLALGMPVIATRVGEFPDFIQSNEIGLLIDGEMRAEELADAMRLLIANDDLFAGMSQNAIALMSRDEMTWEHEWRKVTNSRAFEFDRRAA